MINKQIQTICGKISGVISRISANSSTKSVKLKKGLVSAAAVLCAGLLIFNVVVDFKSKPVMVLYSGEEKIGCVESRSIFLSAKNTAEQYLADNYSIAYKFPEDSVYYKLTSGKNEKCLTEEQLTLYFINDAEKLFCDGYGLYIDGNLVVIGENLADMEKVLDETLSVYSEIYAKIKTAQDIISFNSKTEIHEVKVPRTMIKSYNEIRSIIGLDSMANLNDILLCESSDIDEFALSDISEYIPEIDNITEVDISLGLPMENLYYIGMPEDNASEPNRQRTAMSFRASSFDVSREAIPYEEEIIYDAELCQGEKILETSGVYGVKEITYEVTYINGEENTRKLISENVVKEPVSKVYRVGTKKTSSLDNNVVTTCSPVKKGSTTTTPTHTFIFPACGTLTSSYQGRKLFGRYEFHGAIDIANRVGTTIVASDGGTVTYAGTFSTYGKCVIIDHGNGYETLYAHLNKISVKEGETVGQGWKIGEMGKTGRVTGSHIHFELRVDGEKVDPMDYLTK